MPDSFAGLYWSVTRFCLVSTGYFDDDVSLLGNAVHYLEYRNDLSFEILFHSEEIEYLFMETTGGECLYFIRGKWRMLLCLDQGNEGSDTQKEPFSYIYGTLLEEL